MLRNRRIRLGSGFAIALAILLASTSVVQANSYWTVSSGTASWTTNWDWMNWGGYVWNHNYPSIADTDFLVSPGTCEINNLPFTSGAAWIYTGGSFSAAAFGSAGSVTAASNGSLYITTGGDLEMTFNNYGGGMKVGGWSAYQAADGNATLSYSPSNYSGTVTQDGGTVNCLGTHAGSEGYEYIGCNGNGTSYYNQSGGINSVGHVILGGTSATGYYNLNGGTLTRREHYRTRQRRNQLRRRNLEVCR